MIGLSLMLFAILLSLIGIGRSLFRIANALERRP